MSSSSNSDLPEKYRSRFRKRFKRPFPQHSDSNVQRFAAGFGTKYEQLGAYFEQIAISHRIDLASGTTLDRIGTFFGTLGRRRGRGDDEYRRFLQSIVDTFRGRGTKDGIKFAVSAGVGADDPDEILIDEFFDALEYQLTITNWASHSGIDVRYLADLADPSVVKLREPLQYYYRGDAIGLLEGRRRVESRTLGGDSIGLVEGEISVETDDRGRFDGLDEFGDGDEFGPDTDYGEDGFGEDVYGE
jgi:hypothetical protein